MPTFGTLQHKSDITGIYGADASRARCGKNQCTSLNTPDFFSSARIFTSGTKKLVQVQPGISGLVELFYNSNTTALPQRLCHPSVPLCKAHKSVEPPWNTHLNRPASLGALLRVQRQQSLPSTEHHSSTWQPQTWLRTTSTPGYGCQGIFYCNG